MCEHASEQEAVYARVAAHIDAHHARDEAATATEYAYGTAGFRTEATRLVGVVARVACIVALRACAVTATSASSSPHRQQQSSRAPRCIGVVVTASHNPPGDNGVKIVDADGGMLNAAWEVWCTRAANARSGREVADVMRACAAAMRVVAAGDDDAREHACLACALQRGVVRVARDTRPSGVALVAALRDVLSSVLRVTLIDHGVATTPQLHAAVALANNSSGLVVDAYTPASLLRDAYEEQLCVAYDTLLRLVCDDAHAAARRTRVVVDAANGVGALALRRLLARAAERRCAAGGDGVGGGLLAATLDVVVVDDAVDDAAALNRACGADAAKLSGQPSAAMRAHADLTNGGDDDDDAVHYYCLDGDADRLVAFYCARESAAATRSWRLLDGDRIAILYAMLLQHLLRPTAAAHDDDDDDAAVARGLRVGMVQTAYANGAARAFAEGTLRLPVCVAKTGVKHLHAAAQALDVGVYFEANGHGTVLCQPARCAAALATWRDAARAERVRASLQALCALASQVCGDAVADMLLCEVALRALRLSLRAWAALYSDFAAVQRKVAVAHPRRIVCCDADEARACAPDGLQAAIDAAVARCGDAHARAFARPSGTEAVVRVYAEAADSDTCAQLADAVTRIVQHYGDA